MTVVASYTRVRKKYAQHSVEHVPNRIYFETEVFCLTEISSEDSFFLRHVANEI